MGALHEGRLAVQNQAERIEGRSSQRAPTKR